MVTFGINGELLRTRDIPTKAKLRAGHAANFVWSLSCNVDRGAWGFNNDTATAADELWLIVARGEVWLEVRSGWSSVAVNL